MNDAKLFWSSKFPHLSIIWIGPRALSNAFHKYLTPQLVEIIRFPNEAHNENWPGYWSDHKEAQKAADWYNRITGQLKPKSETK